MSVDLEKFARHSVSIELDRICKTYGSFTALDNLTMSIGSGEFLTLLGPSGSGKTTLLMILAGFVRADSGSVKFGDSEVIQLPPHKRGVGMVFQSYALFPHMTVAENIAYPLKLRQMPKPEIEKRVCEVLEVVQLKGLGDRRPTELSGGQKQRVALARSIVFEPRVLLMDEPLSALDKNLREAMQLEIRRLHDRLGVTTVYVTHDQREALTMSDRIVVMNNGRIEQIGTPREIYDEPRTAFVGTFVGESYLIPVQVHASSPCVLDRPLFASRHPSYRDGSAYDLLIRPERLKLGASSDPETNAFPVVLQGIVYQGDTALVNMTMTNGTEIGVRLPAHDPWLREHHPLGSPFILSLDPQHAIIVQNQRAGGAVSELANGYIKENAKLAGYVATV